MKKEIRFFFNDNFIKTEINPSVTCLDYIRYERRLTGTKVVCREGDCGACTILVGTLEKGEVRYRNINSCLLPIGAVDKKHIVTIEGINQKELNFIQKSFIEEGATQCGFCTPGFILSLTAYFLSSENLNYEDAIDFIAGNVCRCTGHISIKNVVEKIIKSINIEALKSKDNISRCIELGIIPEYFHYVITEMKKSFLEKREKDEPAFHRVNVAGGTDIYVQKADELIEKDINLIAEFDPDETKISIVNDKVVIKANTTITEFAESPIINNLIPQIKKYAKYFGSLQIRNKATIGGNISNASPIADMTNILLALNSCVILEGLAGFREIPLKKLFLGYKNLDIQKDELIKEISFKIFNNEYKFNYEKVSRREMLDIASVNSSILISVKDGIIQDVNLSAGGVAPIPLCLSKTKEFLLNKKLEKSLIKDATSVIESEISPISDVRGSAEYKRLLLRQLFYAHFIKLFPDMNFEEILL